MLGRSARATLIAAVVASAAVIGAACSGSGENSAVTTVLATATTYATVPLRSTTTTQATAVRNNDNGDVEVQPTTLDRSVEQPYVIRSGDYILSIANDFDVPYQDLIEFNGWTDGVDHALVPGETIRIPPANYDPNAADATATSQAPDSSGGESAGGQCPDGSPQQTYTIKSGDVKFRVADSLQTTVSELDAANADTPRYTAFVVGIEILVPC